MIVCVVFTPQETHNQPLEALAWNSVVWLSNSLRASQAKVRAVAIFGFKIFNRLYEFYDCFSMRLIAVSSNKRLLQCVRRFQLTGIVEEYVWDK